MSEHDDPTLKVARDLSEILTLSGQLDDQAEHAYAAKDMPGGPALAALAPAANLEAFEHRIESAERLHYETCPSEDHAQCKIAEHVVDQDDEHECFKLLRFWSEGWRREHARESDLPPVIAGEARFLQSALTWAYDNEPRWEDFTRDVEAARIGLENMLHAGVRNQYGVRCFDCDTDLVRRARDPREPNHCHGHDGICYWPHQTCPHDRGGLEDEWRCPSCDRRYDAEAYLRAVKQAHIANAAYLPLTDCMERTGASRGSIQGWASKGYVRRHQDINSGRTTYCVDDVETRQRKDVA